MPGSRDGRATRLLRIRPEVADSYHHQVGSCKMGSEMAVVDPELRVYGVAGLARRRRQHHAHRVTGNRHAGILMIAERAQT